MPEVKNAVDLALEKQRKEGEARSILQDLERLITTSIDRKRRWVWELIQNAKDCALPNSNVGKRGVNITFRLEPSKLTFEHDGEPFDLNSLLAIVRRTSTKSYGNSDGNTGKFGTGFVTTHVLNKKVRLSGVLKNDIGQRGFELTIDRSANSLPALQTELESLFLIINDFYNQPPSYLEIQPNTCYVYELDTDTFKLAADSIDELVSNLSFILLVNPSISSVVIEDCRTQTRQLFSVRETSLFSSDIKFAEQIIPDRTEEKSGILTSSVNGLTIGVPAVYKNGALSLGRLTRQSRLYKEFPLIGTEDWHIPFFLQSAEFFPSEPRDGIRTIKENETKEDLTADKNRTALIQFVPTAINFFKALTKENVGNLHLLAESGSPFEKTEYTSAEWYLKNVQIPLRKFFLENSLIKTASGASIKISQAKVPFNYPDESINDKFYKLAVGFYYSKFPEESSYKDWQRIISQDTITWGSNIICDVEELVREVDQSNGSFDLFLKEGSTIVDWINDLIHFLELVEKSQLSQTYRIYPAQSGKLKKKQELRVDPGVNSQIKLVGKILNLPIFDQLLDSRITYKNGVDVFDEKVLFNEVNVAIGSLTPSLENSEQYKAVFRLIGMFGERHAPERENWFQLAKQLFQDMVPDRIVIRDMVDFKWASAELASVKYTCWTVEQAGDFETFKMRYFQKDEESSFHWLNQFIEVLFRNQDYQELIRKYKVIPVQSGEFRKMEDGVYREQEPFPDLFKQLYTEFVGKANAKSFLIASNITSENLDSKRCESLTKAIDDLFASPDIENKVEPGNPFNQLFHRLNEWFGSNQEEGEMLFRLFSRLRPMLYIKAFGPEVSKIVMAIHKLKKPIEEIEALAKLRMSAKELEKLILASQMAGGTEKLLEAASEMHERAREVQRRKEIGTLAEEAFKNAIAGINPFMIENPDMGYDFEITIPESDKMYFLEIKSTVRGQLGVQMSSLQGKTAEQNRGRYALCVLVRENGETEVTKDFFVHHAKFLTNIGDSVASKVLGMEKDLSAVRVHKIGVDVTTALEDEKYSVHVPRNTWEWAISFNDFVNHLKTYFKLPS